MISKWKKAICKENLEELRSSTWSIVTVGERLHYYYPPYSQELFGLRNPGRRCPCYMFGKQLVLKIIDELLD